MSRAPASRSPGCACRAVGGGASRRPWSPTPAGSACRSGGGASSPSARRSSRASCRAPSGGAACAPATDGRRRLPAVTRHRLCRRHRHPARRPPSAQAAAVPRPAPDRLGVERAEHWLSVRAWMEPRGLRALRGGGQQHQPGTRLCLRPRARRTSRRRAADRAGGRPSGVDNATGEWHVDRVRYPFRPGYGRHPGLMLAARPGGGWRVPLLQRHSWVARGEALTGISTTSPTSPT